MWINDLTLGKTTLIRLLAFLDKPTVGEIYINDVNVSRYDPKILRINMSILFQEFRITFVGMVLIQF